MIKIERLTKLTQADSDALCRLMLQLSPNCQPSANKLRRVLAAANAHLFVVREKDVIVATATLAAYPSPTGKKAWVEDVVVDAAYRGKGYGRALLAALIGRARQMRVQQLMLTSKPARVEANALYQNIGFEMRETNVYRLKY